MGVRLTKQERLSGYVLLQMGVTIASFPLCMFAINVLRFFGRYDEAHNIGAHLFYYGCGVIAAGIVTIQVVRVINCPRRK